MIEILTVAGTSQALFLGFYFWLNRKIAGFLYFSVLILLLGILFIIGYLYETKQIIQFPHLARTGFPINGALGPLFFIAIRSFVRQKNDLSKKDLLLFIVPVSQLIYLFEFFFSSQEMKLAYLKEDLVLVHLDCQVMNYSSFINEIFFFALSLHLIGSILKNNKKYSYHRNQQYLYQKNIYPFILILIIITVSLGVASIFNPNIVNTGLPAAVATIFIIVLSYYTIYFSKKKKEAENLDKEARKYEKTLIDDEKIEILGSKIKKFLDNEKPFTESEFQLRNIADYLGLSLNLTSQVFNRYFKKNFFDLINEYRINSAKLSMQDEKYKDYSILRIAYESGFNSKSNFNRIFKKSTNITPSKWRENIQNKINS